MENIDFLNIIAPNYMTIISGDNGLGKTSALCNIHGNMDPNCFAFVGDSVPSGDILKHHIKMVSFFNESESFVLPNFHTKQQIGFKDAFFAWFEYILPNSDIERVKNLFEQMSGKESGFDEDLVDVGFLSKAEKRIISIVLWALYWDSENKYFLLDDAELYLCPKSQSRLIELLCKLAQIGQYIILTTNSDHIVNGVLVNHKLKRIDKEKIIFYHIQDRENILKLFPNDKSIITGIKKGFFDQIDNDLDTILYC